MIAGLAHHLEQTYGVGVARVAPFEPWAPDGVQRVDRTDGRAWVARVFPADRPLEVTRGDAEVLRFLESHGYPAERCAADDPVSLFRDCAVLVTECVPGVNARGDSTSSTARRIGELVATLHALPSAPGAVSRPGGGWHGACPEGGGRRADVAALSPLLEKAASHLDHEQRRLFDKLGDELDAVDACEDLPQALVHCDLGGPNVVVGEDGSLTVIDWTGAGRGPRVHSLVALCNPNLELVDAFVAGYREHLQLTAAELDRLEHALSVHSLVLDCWMFLHGLTPIERVAANRTAAHDLAARAADRARLAFAA